MGSVNINRKWILNCMKTPFGTDLVVDPISVQIGRWHLSICNEAWKPWVITTVGQHIPKPQCWAVCHPQKACRPQHQGPVRAASASWRFGYPAGGVAAWICQVCILKRLVHQSNKAHTKINVQNVSKPIQVAFAIRTNLPSYFGKEKDNGLAMCSFDVGV